MTYDWFPVNVNRDGCLMWGQETLTLSGTSDFTHFGELMFSPIHLFIISTSQNLSVLRLRLWIKDSGLFAWISLTALSRIYFIALNWSENSFWPTTKTW